MKKIVSTTKVHLAIPDKIYDYYTKWATEDLKEEDNPINESSLARKRAEIMIGILRGFRERNDIDYLDSEWGEE